MKERKKALKTNYINQNHENEKNGFPNVFPLIPYNLQMCDVRWQRNNNKERNKRKIKQTYKTKRKLSLMCIADWIL